MGIRIQTVDGREPSEGVRDILDRAVALMESDAAKDFPKTLSDAVKSHFARRFPGSSHFSPDKVAEGVGSSAAGTAEGSAEIGAAGASRAYRDVTIRPVRRQSLTIPMHSSAFGKTPAEVSGLFRWKSRSGKSFLAKEGEGGSLMLMWLLAKEAFQPKDETVMPSDETLGNALMKAITERI